MSEKIIVGPINGGLRNNRTAFIIDNDSFPTLVNAYQWRGRLKRKRGTQFLGRLQRFFDSTSTSYNSGSTTIVLDVNNQTNILTGFGLQANGNIVPGTVIIIDLTSGNTFTDPSLDGILVGNPVGSGTIIYSTGLITLSVGAAPGDLITVSFFYFPDLPVMGLEDFKITTNAFPATLGFDTKYSYEISTSSPYTIFDVSFYKNPGVSVLLPAYIPKTVWTPTTWNGQDYQQFWSLNYQGAFWVTNGINIPFTGANIGMQFAPALTITYVSNTATTITVTIAGNPLVIGDFVFFNEWTGINSVNLNFQTGYVISIVGANITIELPFATLGAGPYIPGIIQYLTNRSDPTVDCIRWFDGDPVNATNSPVFAQGRGWVNFMPPLSQGIYSIAQTPPRQYYLVGGRMLEAYKDRLLVIGPVIQASTGGPIYLQDTVIYSQNGTPYYTASFTGDVDLVTTEFHQILVPENETATPGAWFEDQTGFGGFVSAGIDKPAVTVSTNEDVLIIGFDADTQTKLIYSGNDIIPFNFYLINSEYGSSSTFSAINMDEGVLTRGHRGIIITSQDSAKRIDLQIPDQVFQFGLLNNGTERVTSQRDFINEWVYFTYLRNEKSNENDIIYKFPNQTLFLNYRDNSWAIFNESYTHYGQFKKQTGFTWATVGNIYHTWAEWNDPWDSGESTLLQPDIIAGNQQGFVLIRDEGTEESESLYIKSFSGSLVTSPDHGLSIGDYIVINDTIGTISTQVNGKIFSVNYPITENTFTLAPTITSGTYFGGGTITRMYIPFIQTKQFPAAWGLGRKTRIGVQRYLLTTTANAQITLNIFLSQNSANPYTFGPIVPALDPKNSSLIYSTILFTCPESTNLGLTAYTKNLMTPTAPEQQQIWHRKNTSLIGDTVQLGFTMSDKQMRDVDTLGRFISQFAEIELHAFMIDVSPSQMLV